jgi:hypothetical protein
MVTNDTILRRVHSHVDFFGSGGHWYWNGPVTLGFQNPEDKALFHLLPTTVIWVLYKGELPHGFTIAAVCGETRCANPDHLRPLISGRVYSARSTIGPNRSKRTAAKDEWIAWGILEDFAAGFTVRGIAQKYGCTFSSVEKIIKGKRWSEVYKLWCNHCLRRMERTEEYGPDEIVLYDLWFSSKRPGQRSYIQYQEA